MLLEKAKKLCLYRTLLISVGTGQEKKLVEFCKRTYTYVTNTWFTHRRRTTWTKREVKVQKAGFWVIGQAISWNWLSLNRKQAMGYGMCGFHDNDFNPSCLLANKKKLSYRRNSARCGWRWF